MHETPVFESDGYNPAMMRYSPWAGHRPFAYDYVANVRPACIVELGSYYGCSSFAFLQAVKDFGLSSAFWAVDTWEGDSFTESDYREDICGQYRQIQDACFAGQKAHMLRMTFDEAAARFADASIDLLHIDGSHRYEDVRHDYASWKDKVKPDGAVFFHDIGEDLLFGEPMGSHRFWQELKGREPLTVEFPFSFGLGILFFRRDVYENFLDRVDLQLYQQLANREDARNRDALRRQYFENRDLQFWVKDLQRQLEEKQTHLEAYGADTARKEAWIGELQEDVRNYRELTESKEGYIAELQETICGYEETAAGKDAWIGELQEDVRKYEKLTESKETYIRELQETIRGYEETAAGKDAWIGELQEGVRKCEQLTESKETYIRELQETIRGYEETAAGKDAWIGELQEDIRKCTELAESKDAYIRELQKTIRSYEETVAGKDAWIAELQEAVRKYGEDTAGKDAWIRALEQRLAEAEAESGRREARIRELEDALRQLNTEAGALRQYRAAVEQTWLGRRMSRRMETQLGTEEA